MSASSSSAPSSSSAASATSASTAVSSRPTTAVVEVSALVVGRSGGSSSCSLRSRRAIASSISSTRASQCCRSAFGAGDTRCSVYMLTERTCARSRMGPRHRQPSRFAFARRIRGSPSVRMPDCVCGHAASREERSCDLHGNCLPNSGGPAMPRVSQSRSASALRRIRRVGDLVAAWPRIHPPRFFFHFFSNCKNHRLSPGRSSRL